MIDPHLFLCEADASVPGRWLQAFPEGRRLDEAGLHQRLRSHALAHGIVWLPASGRDPWADRMARLLTLQGDLRIVLLSGVPTEDEGLQAIQAGARGYAHSHAAPALLQEVALVVHHGGLWLGPDLMRRLVQATATALARTVGRHSPLAVATKRTDKGTPEGPNAAWSRLTARERQMAQAVAQGRSNKEIAQRLRISEKTVKAHLGAVFQKLGVRDRLQLVVRMAAVDANPSPEKKARQAEPPAETPS